MNLAALLTSAGFNIAICIGLFSFYSILRKQPVNVKVYFGQRLAQLKPTQSQFFYLDRFVPSAGWLVKAWEASEDEIYACGGIDGLVIIKMVVFSIRIFSIAAIVCIFAVLPMNFLGGGLQRTTVYSEMDVFTIGNIRDGSRGFWAHCVALYVISLSGCVLLYLDFRSVARMRLEQVTRFATKPSHFTVLVRGIPWSPVEPYSETVRKHFSDYFESSYLAHQMVYRTGTVQRLMMDAEKMYKVLTTTPINPINQCCKPNLVGCGLCGVPTNTFEKLKSDAEGDLKKNSYADDVSLTEQECEAALVFFRTRYAAMVASHTIQSTDPMLWVIDSAPEPQDVYWPNLCVPYRILWIRKTLVYIATVLFSIWFLLPATFVQGLTKLRQLERAFPFLRGISNKSYVYIITGYLPTAVLVLFVSFVPPLMLLFATLEGAVSRSARKKSACCKVTVFLFWNIFFFTLFTGTWMDRLGMLTVTSLRDFIVLLAQLIPGQASFFMTLVMTYGWASLAWELMQPCVLLVNWFYKCILRRKEGFGDPYTFPYHIEIPRVLLFGLLGFTFCILQPLILPFLLVYFFFAYLIYRNQILNVYITRYNTDGLYWPIAHNATIFSLLVMQSVACIIFTMKDSSAASSCTFPLIIFTALFNMFCRHRFLPLFKNNSVQDVIERDRHDEHSGTLEEIVPRLLSSYSQFKSYAGNHPTDLYSDQYKTNNEDNLSKQKT